MNWWKRRSKTSKIVIVIAGVWISLSVVQAMVDAVEGAIAKQEQPVPSAPPAPVTTVTTTAPTTTTTVAPTTTTTTVPTLTALVKDAVPGVTDVSATIKAGAVTVTYDYGIAWDNNSMLKGAGRKAVEYFRVLFARPEVQTVKVVATTVFVDPYAKESMRPAITITWDRATADKVDWENYKALGDRWQGPYQLASYYSIYPGLWKGLTDEYRIAIEGGGE